jgi:radical SAM protein with 4Fe4S-binding SPASM domain
MALFGNDADHMDVFIYGCWDKKSKRIVYDEEKIYKLRSRTHQNIDSCASCSIAPFCRGYCPGEVMNETNDFLGCKSVICTPTKIIFDRLTEEEKKYEYHHP